MRQPLPVRREAFMRYLAQAFGHALWNECLPRMPPG
jgi:hypothetical protein